MSLRHAVHLALEGAHPRLGRAVAFGLNAVILLSATAIALETLEDLPLWAARGLHHVETVVIVIFTIEYLTRLICAPRPLAYALSFWGIVDLVSCLPALALVNAQWAALRSIRLIRLIRLLKVLRTSQALDRLQTALQSVRGDLMIFAVLASIIIYIAALGIYIFEHDAQPDVFGSIPESAWWAIVSFTTVGYGDACPITVGGRVFTSLMLFVGLGVIAVPTAVITSALISHSRDDLERKERHAASQKALHHHAARPRAGNRGHGPRPRG